MVRPSLWTLAGVAAGLALAFSLSRSEVRAQSAGCPQWEVMLATPPPVAMVQPSEMGKPVVEKAPAGWEPFAYSPSGTLVFRRCAGR